jgi:transposase
LSTQEVKDIRAEYLQGATQKKLADTYGLSIKSIYKIVHLIDYKHIKEDDSYLTRLSERLST